MKHFQDAITEVRSTLAKLLVFEAALNAILVFLIAFLLLSIFNLPLIYPIAVAALYFFIYVRNKSKLSKIRMVEQKYSNLNEKLRTAAEYTNEENRVINSLHSEVLQDLRNVQESSFISEKKLFTKTGVIIALCFLIFLLSPVTLGILDFNLNLLDNKAEAASELPIGGGESQSKIRYTIGSEGAGLTKIGEDIYGTASIAKIGDEEVKIRIKPAGTELSIRQIQEAEPIDFSESYPSEVHAVAARSFEEEIPKEDLQLVRDYFNELAKGQ